MPPRIQSQRVSNSLLPYLSSPSASSTTRIPLSSSSCSPSPSSSRSFSSTQYTQTQRRREMISWLQGEGARLKTHTPGQPNYLSTRRGPPGLPSRQPFPQNPAFVSESILSEELRNEIYQQVVVRKKSIRAVSAEMGVDMRRVAAVCRLVEIEKRWRQQGKPLALPYARSVHEMIATTPLYEDARSRRERPHESINDLPSHRLTDAQIFYPVSESRHFTRSDAGRVFSAAPARLHGVVAKEVANPDETVSRITQNPSKIETVGKGADEQPVLQAADVRIPHPYLVAYERDREARPEERNKVFKAHAERLEKEEAAEKERKRFAEERRERNMSHVKPESSRFEFRINDVAVSRETTGTDGRGHKAPGRRYGVPSYERKKGQVNDPTRVVV